MHSCVAEDSLGADELLCYQKLFDLQKASGGLLPLEPEFGRDCWSCLGLLQ